jgi:hypothetical protein
MTSGNEETDEATFDLLNCELLEEFDEDMTEELVFGNDQSVSKCDKGSANRFVYHDTDQIVKFIESKQNSNTLKRHSLI